MTPGSYRARLYIVPLSRGNLITKSGFLGFFFHYETASTICRVMASFHRLDFIRCAHSGALFLRYGNPPTGCHQSPATSYKCQSRRFSARAFQSTVSTGSEFQQRKKKSKTKLFDWQAGVTNSTSRTHARKRKRCHNNNNNNKKRKKKNVEEKTEGPKKMHLYGAECHKEEESWRQRGH